MQSSSHSSTNKPAEAVKFVCRLLHSYGIDQLTPELVRQAKFDAARCREPLLLALHDLVLLVSVGLPDDCAGALRRLKQQLQQEAVQDTQVLSRPGRLLMLHYLTDWGCPAGLIAELTLPLPSSRAVLLALCWLIAHGQLFEKALQHMQLPQQLLPWLPPFPEDTSLTLNAQSQARAAATLAQQHCNRVQELFRGLTSAPAPAPAAPAPAPAAAAAAGPQPSTAGISHWPAVQAAAHHVLSTYRAASLRLQQLTALVEGREKLLHEIQQLQVQLKQQQSPAPLSSSSCSSGAKKMQLLTAFELHLLANPPLLHKHQQALQQACSILQQQQQCMQHAQVFFAWAKSAIAQQQQQAQEQPSPPQQQQYQQQQHVRATAYARHGSTSTSRQQQMASTATKQQAEGAAEPAISDILPLVHQLPPASTPLAAHVLTKVMQQLQQAAASAGLQVIRPEAQDITHTATHPAHAATAGAAAALADLSIAAEHGIVTQQQQQQQQQQQHDVASRFVQVAAAALVQHGMQPDTAVSELVPLPQDLLKALQHQQELQQHQHQQRAQQAAAQLDIRAQLLSRQYAPQDDGQHSSRSSANSSTAAAATSQNRSRPTSAGAARRAHVQGAAGPPGSSNAALGVGVDVAQEMQRLNRLALEAARQLAKVRAANKQQLQAAADLLLAGGGGDSSGSPQLVLYQQ